MVEVTINKHSSALSRLYQDVLRHASKNSENGGNTKEAFLKSINKVMDDSFKLCDATVHTIDKLQFRAEEKVPIDFYLNLGFVNSDHVSALSQTLLEKLAEEGHLV